VRSDPFSQLVLGTPLIKLAQCILCLPFINGQSFQSFLPLAVDRVTNLRRPRADPALERLRTHIQPIPTPSLAFIVPGDCMHALVVKNVNRNLLPFCISRFLNSESPKQPSDSDESPLLRQTLTTANPSTPSKSHVPSFIWERPEVRTIFKISFWIEAIGIRELLAMVNGPDISLNPSPLWNIPPLEFVSFRLSFQLLMSPCIYHLGWVHVAGRQ
jgi:hypothetical protein